MSKKIYFICVDILSTYLNVHHMYAVPLEAEERVRPLTLELQMVLSQHMNADQETRILRKSNCCS